MPIEEKEVKVFRQVLLCECGGKMKFNGVMIATYPAQYPHICDKCGKKEMRNECYPLIIYKDE